MWENWNPCVLLVEMWKGNAHLEVPQQLKHRITKWSSNSASESISKKNKTKKNWKGGLKKIYIPMFKAALLIADKEATQASYDRWMDRQNTSHLECSNS